MFGRKNIRLMAFRIASKGSPPVAPEAPDHLLAAALPAPARVAERPGRESIVSATRFSCASPGLPTSVSVFCFSQSLNGPSMNSMSALPVKLLRPYAVVA